MKANIGLSPAQIKRKYSQRKYPTVKATHAARELADELARLKKKHKTDVDIARPTW